MKRIVLGCTGLLLGLGLSSCGGTTLLRSSQNLYEVYKDDFTIGGTFNSYNLDSPLISHFSSMTSENAMKWVSVHPSLDTYTYKEADTYISTAQTHSIGVRGHALIWHNAAAMPQDVFLDASGATIGKEALLQRERDHIDNVVTHFADKVYCWDVCNEVIDDGTTPLAEDGSNIYRQSDWYNICGRDFIKEAYVEADKVLKKLGIRDKVKLIYNDYDNTKAVKRSKTLAMLRWLQEEGAPIDGVGLQCHYHLGSFDPDELEASIKAYSELGLDVQITEFDVNIYDMGAAEALSYPNYFDVPQETLDVQATIYDRAFEIFRRNSSLISNVTFWGVADNVCYMNDNKDYGYRNNYPFLFDVNQGKKPCFYAITDYPEASK